LYDTLGDEAIEFIVQKSTIPLVFASADKAAILVKLHAKLPTLKAIVLMNDAEKSLSDLAATTSIKLVTLKTLEEEGSKMLVPHVKVEPTKVATISFTSGTTGQPKGVLLTHQNLLSFLTGNP
jgi:long-chain acyl-CoA synthetase